jgi:excisionase family DNA binding protein
LDRILTVKDVQDVLSVGRSYAYKLVQTGELKSVRVGRCVRVRGSDLQAYIEGLSVNIG